MKKRLQYWKSGSIVLLTVLIVIFLIHLSDFAILKPRIMASRQAFIKDRMDNIANVIERRTCCYFDSVYNNLTLSHRDINNLDNIYSLCDKIINSNDDFLAMDVIINPDILPQFKEEQPTILRGGKRLNTYSNDSLNINPSFNLEKFDELDRKQEFVTEPFISKACNNSKIITMVMPYLDKSSSISAVLQMAISVDSLTSHLNNANPYSLGEIFVISEGGKFIMNSDTSLITEPAYDWIEKRYSSVAIDMIKSQNQTTESEIRIIPDKKYLYYAAYNDQSHWCIFYVVPISEIIKDLQSIIFIVILISLLGVIVIVVICYFTTRSTAREKAKEVMIENELKTASEIQASMLSKPAINSENLDIDTNLIPARVVGGDLYNYYFQDDTLFFCIGDVSGKGIPAAMFMSRALSLIRCVGDLTNLSPGKFMSLINKELNINNDQCLFVTMFIGALNIKTGVLSYCNAGHEYPILIDSESTRFLETETNLPLGISSEIKFKEESVTLDKSCTIFLYTDGIDEATNSSNELYGKERLINCMNKVKGMSAHEINSSLLDDVNSFVANNEQSDDITILTINYKR